MFFEISGFLFAIAYIERIKSGNLEFASFLKNRIIKIYPMMILSTIIMAILEYIYFFIKKEWWLSAADVWHVFISILGIPVGWFESNFTINMPIWYISILFQCYILAFVLTAIGKKYKNGYFIYIMPIFWALAIDYSGLAGSGYLWLNPHTSRGFKAFFTAILLAEYLKKIDEIKKVIMLKCCYSTLFLIGILVCLFGENILGSTLYVLDFIIYPCIIVISLYSSIWNKLLGTKGIYYLGKISYEIYLWNLPTQILTFIVEEIVGINFSYSSKVFFMAHMIISILLASVVYRYVEKPLMGIVKKDKA